jgi:hypothetical protein
MSAGVPRAGDRTLTSHEAAYLLAQRRQDEWLGDHGHSCCLEPVANRRVLSEPDRRETDLASKSARGDRDAVPADYAIDVQRREPPSLGGGSVAVSIPASDRFLAVYARIAIRVSRHGTSSRLTEFSSQEFSSAPQGQARVYTLRRDRR